MIKNFSNFQICTYDKSFEKEFQDFRKRALDEGSESLSVDKFDTKDL